MGHCDRNPLVCLTFTCKQHHPTHRAWETADRQNHTTISNAANLFIYRTKAKTTIQCMYTDQPPPRPPPRLSHADSARVCLLVLYTPKRKWMRTYGRCTGSLRSRSSIRDSSTHGDGIHTHSACGKISANQQSFLRKIPILFVTHVPLYMYLPQKQKLCIK